MKKSQSKVKSPRVKKKLQVNVYEISAEAANGGVL